MHCSRWLGKFVLILTKMRREIALIPCLIFVRYINNNNEWEIRHHKYSLKFSNYSDVLREDEADINLPQHAMGMITHLGGTHPFFFYLLFLVSLFSRMNLSTKTLPFFFQQVRTSIIATISSIDLKLWTKLGNSSTAENFLNNWIKVKNINS